MHRVKLLIVVLVIAGIGLSWTAVAHAQDNFRAGTDVTVPEGQTVDKSLFVYGTTIDIAGTVNGDVFCFGREITITGNVTGDVICAGQTVTIAADVRGNIRVVGQTITVGGETGHNLTAAGQSLLIGQSGKVDGDATIAAQSATINGVVGRDLAADANALTINGAVNRNVRATVTDNLALGGNVLIGGSLTYLSNQPLSRATGAQVGGKITHGQLPSSRHSLNVGTLIGGGFLLSLYLFIALLTISLAVVLIVPQFVHTASEVAITAPWKTLLVGFVASIVAPAVIFMLMCTIVGIPLALLAGLLWLVAVCLAMPFAAYYLGRLLLGPRPTNAVVTMLLGAAVILVLYMIPLISFITWLIATWFGLGIIVLQARRLPRPSYK